MTQALLQLFKDLRMRAYAYYLAEGLDPGDAWSTATRDASEVL